MSGLGILLAGRAQGDFKKRIFSLCLFCIAWWSLGVSIHALTETETWGMFWSKFLHIGAIFVPITYLHFILSFLNKKKPLLMQCLYCLGGLFVLCLLFSNIFLKEVSPIYIFPYFPKAGYIYSFFLFMFGACVIYSLFLLLRALQSSSGMERSKLNYIFWSSVVGYIGGPTAFLPMYNVRILPLGVPLVSIFGIAITIAILKHHLMDISIIIRKTLIYSTVTGVLTAVYLVTIAIFAHIFEGLAGYQTIFSSAIAAALITLGFQPLRKRVQIFVDQKFFREYVDREQKLYELSREVITHTTSEGMAEALMRVLTESLHPKTVALYLKPNDGNGFLKISGHGTEVDLPQLMPEDNALANYFSDHSQPLTLDGEEAVGESQNTRSLNRKDNGISIRTVCRKVLHRKITELSTGSKSSDENARQKTVSIEMRKSGINAAFPLVNQGELMGFLLLGEKMSEAPYSGDDILLLRIVANQTALAYQRVRYLEMAVRGARTEMLGQIAGGFAHEIKTPLANISLPAEMAYMDLKDVEEGNRTFQEILPELKNRMRDIMMQAMKVSEKVEAIRQFSKPGDRVQLETIDLNQVIQNSLQLIEHIIRKSATKVSTTLLPKAASIHGNLKQLEIVFVNLIKNAAEAMMLNKTDFTNRNLWITVEENNGWIEARVRDSGPGIRKTDMNHLFDAYFTTKGTEGTGVGLFLSQQVIKAHGGTIDVESEPGTGTTFIIRLPKASMPDKIKDEKAA
jgi:signal transduction histidine kinase